MAVKAKFFLRVSASDTAHSAKASFPPSLFWHLTHAASVYQLFHLRLQMAGIPAPVGVRLGFLGQETDDERFETEMFCDFLDGGEDNLAGEDTFVSIIQEVLK